MRRNKRVLRFQPQPPTGLYSYIGWVSGQPVIRYGVSLGGAWALLKEVGRGAIFRRSDGTNAIPVYPLHRRVPVM